MTLPNGFSPVQHFKSVAIKTYNKIVKEEFKDIDDNLDPDITTPRASLKQACLIDNDDSSIMINNRMMLFYFVLRVAQDLQAPIYGIPVASYNESFKYRPTVTLYFKEDLEDVDPDFQPLRSQISYRLMNKNETTLTKTELTTLATKIKQEFGINNGYKFKRGKVFCSYIDKENGYQLRLFVFSDTEGKEVINKILDLENKTPNWEYLTISQNENPTEAFPTLPPLETILGKQTRLPRKRPVGYVRFTHATCQLWGKTKPVTLYCRTGLLRDGLVD
jgi:hypothetical protein